MGERVSPSISVVRGDDQLPQREIEAFAAAARDLIGVPREKVVNNVTRCIEHIGVLVAPLQAARLNGKVDGISTPSRTSHPFVMTLDLEKPGDRIRFSAAHELGHLLLHTDHRPCESDVREAEAHAFAAAFLLPEGPMRDELSPSLTLAGFAKLKARWGVSIQSTIHRARDLGIIDGDRYRSLFIQLSSRGWRTEEPIELPRETPSTFLASGVPSSARTNAPSDGGGGDQIADVIDLFGRGES